MSEMKRKIICLSIILILFSCNKKDNENVDEIAIAKNNNYTTEISTDVNQLQKLINVSEFKPEKVRFKHILIDNSKGRISGPSDSYLEAILYFDAETMEKIWDIDKRTDFPNPNYQKQNFHFDWLDNGTLSELEKSDSLRNAHPDLIFGTDNGKCWYLKNKILFTKETN